MQKFAIETLPRQPVHVLYGGAHLFRPGLFHKLGQRALALPQAAEAGERVRHKLATEPVEDYRIDFEDGFGYRPDAEEDAMAHLAGEAFRQMAEAGELPFRIGIRPKSDLSRAARTLEIFLRQALAAKLPPRFVVTQPKVQKAEDVQHWRQMLEQAEAHWLLPALSLRHEILVEHPLAFLHLNEIARAGENRLEAAHFGAYDYLSALGVPFSAQSLEHPYALNARHRMLEVLSPLGIAVSDGAFNELPTGSDPAAISRALAGHERQVERALQEGFYCGWDLHPGQLLSRYRALYAYFEKHAAEAERRYRAFLDAETKARVSGTTFDDAATVEGLRVFLSRARSCGALA
jgi:citrate lyase beta subunit